MRLVRVLSTTTLAAALLAVPAPHAAAATFTVNSTADTTDGNCSDGTCTLRDAIEIANLDAAQDTIEFDITGSIQPATALPTITEPLEIDGTSDPDFAGMPVVELDGSTILTSNPADDGLTASAPVDIRGLVINGFPSDGIALQVGSDGSVVAGNFIGTDAAGTAALGNGDSGVSIRSANVTVGGAMASDGNVISGNDGNGVTVFNIILIDATDLTVLNNLIGVGSDGATDLGNGRGIQVQNAPNVTIGQPGAPNVISGNDQEGVFFSSNGFGGAVLRSNLIGTTSDGEVPLPNGEGVEFQGAATPQTVTVGGVGSDDGNLISGNTGDGLIVGTNLDITIQGNKIGTNLAGTMVVGNGGNGIESASPATIGTIDGPAAGGNVISGNALNGIDIGGDGAGSVIQGNVIGSDPSGFGDLGNGVDGIDIHASEGTPSSILIGGPAAARNVVSGNDVVGIDVSGFAGTSIQGNFIGTNGAGALAVPNHTGVRLRGDGTILGGPGDAGNVISGNTNDGVDVGPSVTDSVIQGNLIGVRVDGSNPLGNGDRGIFLSDSDDNLIGGTTAGAGNVIRSNGDAGVVVFDNIQSSNGNAILGNSIDDNTGLGIDLGDDGVTINDLGDPDGGPNSLQNVPEIGFAVSGGGRTFVTGSLNTESATTYRLEFFSSPAADGSGSGEGRTFVAATEVTTDEDGNATFTALGSVPTTPGDVVSGTATKLVGGVPGNTSEFSVAELVPPCFDTAPMGGGVVSGDANGNILCGGPGDDTFIGGGDNDIIFGGGGVDTIAPDTPVGPMNVNLAAQRVFDDGEGGTDVVFDVENVIGTDFDDTIVGDAGKNRLDGAAGDDVLVGGAGNDRLLGRAGEDVLLGQDGIDFLIGGDDVDKAYGGNGNDRLIGEGGDDFLFGHGGVDILVGGPGDDTAHGGADGDKIFGQDGADKLRGSTGDDVFAGGDGNDAILGEQGDDLLLGQAGNDLLNGGPATDSCIGGTGSDNLVGCE